MLILIIHFLKLHAGGFYSIRKFPFKSVFFTTTLREGKQIIMIVMIFADGIILINLRKSENHENLRSLLFQQKSYIFDQRPS